MQKKIIKATEKKTIKFISKNIFKIFLVFAVSYIIMAVITHFSLNYLGNEYRFGQSLTAVFDTNTAIFEFFRAFVILVVTVVITALFVRKLKDKLL